MKVEKLLVWKRSKALAVEIYRELSGLRDYGFRDQITRSVLSVPSNIAEGFERYSEQEKFRFMSIAKGSCGEFTTQALIGAEIGYIPMEVAKKWRQEGFEIARMLGAFMQALRSGKPG